MHGQEEDVVLLYGELRGTSRRRYLLSESWRSVGSGWMKLSRGGGEELRCGSGLRCVLPAALGLRKDFSPSQSNQVCFVFSS